MKQRPILFSTPMVQAILEGMNLDAKKLHQFACCVQLWACALAIRAMWVAKAGIAQTMEFVIHFQVPARVCSRWGAAYRGCPQLSHNVFGLGAVERQPVRWENCAKPVLAAGGIIQH